MTIVNPKDIYDVLPKTNCRKCGNPSCMAFALKMAKQKAFIEDCPEINKAKYIRQKMKLKELASKILSASETSLVIHEERCNGCGNCLISCPPNVSVSLEASGGKGPETDEVTMKIKDGNVVVSNLKLCRRFEEDTETRPCSVCIDACPTKAIEFM